MTRVLDMLPPGCRGTYIFGLTGELMCCRDDEPCLRGGRGDGCPRAQESTEADHYHELLCDQETEPA